MKAYKIFISILLLSLMSFGISAETYNQNGDFSVEIDTLKQTVSSENIETTFDITIENNIELEQDIEILIDEKSGWIIAIPQKDFELSPTEKKTLSLELKTTSDFDYSESVISPDFIKISTKDNYIGSFEFPMVIRGDNQNITLKFTLDIEQKEKLNEIYNAEFATDTISPQKPLGFAIKADNLEESQTVSINLEFAGEKYQLQDTFSPQNNYKIYSQKVPASISPGTYFAKIIIRLEKDNGEIAWEWKEETNLEIEEFIKIDTTENVKKSFIKDQYTITLANLGNVDGKFQTSKNINIIKRWLLTSNVDYTNKANNVTFTTTLLKGETQDIVYEFNYIPIYLIILIIITITGYFYYKKASNPLDVETKIYEIKKVKHEGVKSMKLRIGFENIKEAEIESLKLIFRMPGYLNVEHNSFLLREPNHALKGKDQYKLVWDFKRFEQNDSRILGFTLINKRGILGDIKIPDLEFELKIDGKIKKYYKSLPTIKG